MATATKPKTPARTDAALAAASKKATEQIKAEMSDTAWAGIVETICKLHWRYMCRELNGEVTAE